MVNGNAWIPLLINQDNWQRIAWGAGEAQLPRRGVGPAAPQEEYLELPSGREIASLAPSAPPRNDE